MKRFNSWVQTLCKQKTDWQNVKFDHNNCDIQQFTYYLIALSHIVGMSDKQVIQHFKKALPPKVEAQLLEIDDTNVTTRKMRVLVFLFKTKLPQSTSSCMWEHMTDRNADIKSAEQLNRTKLNTFYEAFYKTWIHTERLSWITLKANQNMTKMKQNPQH